jgi:hypothetical protein
VKVHCIGEPPPESCLFEKTVLWTGKFNCPKIAALKKPAPPGAGCSRSRIADPARSVDVRQHHAAADALRRDVAGETWC